MRVCADAAVDRGARFLRGAVVACCLLAGLVPSLVFASRVRPVNLEEMTLRADRIFHGRCVEVRPALDRDLGLTVTYVTFVPQRTIKGSIHGGRLTIKMLGDQGPAAPTGAAVEGLPTFQVGEEVILFLHGNSRHGLTSPVGFGQGKFDIVRDKEGRPVAINGSGNEHLLDGLSTKARGKLGQRAERSKDHKPVPLDDLLEMAASLSTDN
jgi:hypothetical protein